MLVDAMYYAVFFIGDNGIGNKRINANKYLNLIDGMPDKGVEINNVHYKLINIKTFHIQNSVDNTFFAVCEVKL